MTKFTGINHLALVTGDMEATTHFYRDVLDMPLVATTGNIAGEYPFRHYFFEVSPGNTIAFFEWPHIDRQHKPAGQPAAGNVQFDHVSFNLENEQSLLDLQAKLESYGVEVTEVIDHKIIHSIYFTDPNGIALEASVWIKDPTTTQVDYNDSIFFADPNPVASVKPRIKVY